MEPRVVYSTNELLSATSKDVLPALKKSNVIYQFSCPCESRYRRTYLPKTAEIALLPRNAYFLRVSANLPPSLVPSLLLVIQPFEFIFYKILLVLNIMMTADSPFLPKNALRSIYLLLKPLLSKF